MARERIMIARDGSERIILSADTSEPVTSAVGAKDSVKPEPTSYTGVAQDAGQEASVVGQDVLTQEERDVLTKLMNNDLERSPYVSMLIRTIKALLAKIPAKGKE